jgi:ankyrin repeat protein
LWNLFLACQNSNFDIVQWLIEKQNANINDIDYINSTPIHYAAASGSQEIIYYLLQNNAKIISDNNGNTPLHVVSYIEFKSLHRSSSFAPIHYIQKGNLKVPHSKDRNSHFQ